MDRQITVWITGDQCSMNNTALEAVDKHEARVLMIESMARGNQLKYHKKKLVLIYSVMRHFARELKANGWDVDYYQEHPDFGSALAEHLRKFEPTNIVFMEQSEYGADERLKKMAAGCEVKVTPHCNFISNAEEFERLHSSKEARVTMDRFYRVMRKKTKLLMEGDSPVGGAWNFDKENRQPPGKAMAVNPVREFSPDKITKSVIEMVERHFPDHPGTCDDFIYAVDRAGALRAAEDFFTNRLDQFGPHQDAMLSGKPFLNHSILALYINTCLLHPLELCRQAERIYFEGKAQLASVEGFIRQLIGWREFIWRVYWRMMPEYKQRNHLDAKTSLPDFYWTGQTKMHCMKDGIDTVKKHGYAHHIVRLMVLGNFALIAGLDPLETNDWFASMFVDGYDWVMVPNVIGMTLHADGGYVGTKPYAASANYIGKMSDFCQKCHYNPRKTVGDKACPFNYLYWDFLDRNKEEFANNQRMSLIMKNLTSKDDELMDEIRRNASRLLRSGMADA